MKVSVLGAGGWGTTLAMLLNDNGHEVTLWEFNKTYADTLRNHRENFYYLPKVKISEKILITNDPLEAVKDKELVIIATPTQYIRKSLSSIGDFDFGDCYVVSVSKGIENGSLMLVSDMLLDIFKKINRSNLACLSGPSHAEEVSRKIPTAVVCASENIEAAKTVQKVFSNEFFRVYTSNDLIGTETGGALKNVIAIAAGISDGAGFGDNTKAAIMTRGISEIMKLGVKLGAKKETFYGLSGIGDLIVTCSSQHSRNRKVGYEIGKGRKLKEILEELKMVAEGVPTAKAAFELSKKLSIELPIIEEVYNILFEEADPIESTRNLMLRSLKQE
ncbi:NAD(P)H-dependent glycerol-3-phosphate dehydrogenase [soil metagenome]